MKASFSFRVWVAFLLGITTLLTHRGSAASAQILSWNNLGMHCMDSDYSVFSILPPYNTIEAQLIVAGKLVTNGGDVFVERYRVSPKRGDGRNDEPEWEYRYRVAGFAGSQRLGWSD